MEDEEMGHGISSNAPFRHMQLLLNCMLYSGYQQTCYMGLIHNLNHLEPLFNFT